MKTHLALQRPIAPPAADRQLHADDHDWVVAENEAETGDTWSVDYRTYAKDDTLLWVHNEAVLIRDEAGEPRFWQGVMVACIDILMVMFGGRFFFGERITPPRVAAITLIAIGVLLVGWGGQ